MHTDLKTLRQHIVQRLWEIYRDTTPQMKTIEQSLKEKGIKKLFLDHFAVIDLPGPYSGIPVLTQIFKMLGFVEKGKDYLADKQNDFLWMAEVDSIHSTAREVLPQVVVADFRLDELPLEIKKIIEKYANEVPPPPLKELQKLSMHDENTSLKTFLIQYFSGRDWPLPQTKEFYLVQEFNELLAWVLIFGRKPNHFTLSIHLLDQFVTLCDFHQFIEEELKLSLNSDGGKIKGGKHSGIAQGATNGLPCKFKLADGEIEIPFGFVEFVWRYPRAAVKSPTLWTDFFTDFIAQHANTVIESLYVDR